MFKRQEIKEEKPAFQRTTCYKQFRLNHMRVNSPCKTYADKKRLDGKKRQEIMFIEPEMRGKKVKPPQESEDSEIDELNQQFDFIIN